MDMRDGKVGGQDWRTHGWEMGMQVIASKDAEIEDLKKRLVATEKQLAEAKRKAEELEADLNKTKVCVRRVLGDG